MEFHRSYSDLWAADETKTDFFTHWFRIWGLMVDSCHI